MDADQPSLENCSDNIQISTALLDHLTRLHAAQRGDLVTQFGGPLKYQGLCDTVHLIRELTHQLYTDAFQEQAGVAQVILVILGRYVVLARRCATFDLILKAWAGAVSVHTVFALASFERLL